MTLNYSFSFNKFKTPQQSYLAREGPDVVPDVHRQLMAAPVYLAFEGERAHGAGKRALIRVTGLVHPQRRHRLKTIVTLTAAIPGTRTLLNFINRI